MIKLYQFPPCWDMPNASPFCMKLETYLRMVKLPYETVQVNDPRTAPKGKFPYIMDEGVTVADSTLIIEYLKKKYGDTLDAQLTPAQKALALVVQRMCDEHLYWVLVYNRWVEPANWAVVKEVFFSGMPKLLQLFVPNMICKKMKKDLYSQGMGRHTRDEVYQFGKNDITAIADLLGDKLYLLGEQPTSIDATVYSYLFNVLKTPLASPLQDFLKAQPALLAYCERMKTRFYP